MEKKSSLSLKLELIWWVFTAILAAGVLYPIIKKLPNYPFLVINIIFVIVFITFTRYIFLLKHTFLARQQVIKIGMVLVSILIIAYLINGIHNFQTFIDEQGVDALVGDLPNTQKDSMARYIRAELLFFGVGSIVAAVILPIRLIISVWRVRNRNTV